MENIDKVKDKINELLAIVDKIEHEHAKQVRDVKVINQMTFELLTDFKPKGYFGGGFGCSISFPNGYQISIQCGSGSYCSPREDLASPSMYNTFEIAVFNSNNDFVTSAFVDDCDTSQVKGWVTRDEIIDVIGDINLINK